MEFLIKHLGIDTNINNLGKEIEKSENQEFHPDSFMDNSSYYSENNFKNINQE